MKNTPKLIGRESISEPKDFYPVHSAAVKQACCHKIMAGSLNV